MRVPDSVHACTGVSLVSVILLEVAVYYFLCGVCVLGTDSVASLCKEITWVQAGPYTNLYLTFYQEYLSSNYSYLGFCRSGIFSPLDRSIWLEFQLITFLFKI